MKKEPNSTPDPDMRDEYDFRGGIRGKYAQRYADGSNEGFVIHCLYNQETDEHPQLYFSHNLATGNAVNMARKLAKALDKMNLKRS